MKIFYFICLTGLFAFPAYAEEQTEVIEPAVATDSTQENVMDGIIVTVTEEKTDTAESETAAETTAKEESTVTDSENAEEEAAVTDSETAEKTATPEEEVTISEEVIAETGEEATQENVVTDDVTVAVTEDEPVAKEEPAATESENTEDEPTAKEESAATDSENTEEKTATEEESAASEETSAETGEGETAAAVDLLSATNPEQEKEEIIKTEALPEDFMNNLLTCSPSETERVFEGASEKIVIVGLENDKCHVELAVFTLNIPFEKLTEINTYEDFENLCENEEVATFEYARNYRYANLMSELNQCKEYNNIHHNGRFSAAYPFVKITAVTDMTSQHKDDGCEIIFVNEVVRDGKFIDYSVVCNIPDEKITEMLQQYHELIDLYGAKKIVNEDGSISSRNSVTNTQTYKVDAKLMYELQVNGYCHLATEDGQEEQ